MRKVITFLILFCLPLLCVAQGKIVRKPRPVPVPVPVPTPTTPDLSISSSDGYISGHGYVDLGLSVKWATCNVGASSYSDYGDYFAWGEISAKSSYTEENSLIGRKLPLRMVSGIAGSLSYDAARAQWGGSWRLPIEEECKELVEKCTWIWVTENEHKGCRVQGPNGKSIFLPAAGWRDDKVLNHDESTGNYWNSKPFGFGTGTSGGFNFNSKEWNMCYNYRYRGLSIRPVLD